MATTNVADTSSSGFVPAKQRVWRIVRKGKPSKALVLDNNAPVPTLKSDEVLVRVQAASFNNVSVSLFIERGLLKTYLPLTEYTFS